MFHVSHVTCHMSRVMCHLSHVRISFFFYILEGLLSTGPTPFCCQKLVPKQFSGKKGDGNEHMVVSLMNIVLYLLDIQLTRSVVIKAGVDWSNGY